MLLEAAPELATLAADAGGQAVILGAHGKTPWHALCPRLRQRNGGNAAAAEALDAVTAAVEGRPPAKADTAAEAAAAAAKAATQAAMDALLLEGRPTCFFS